MRKNQADDFCHREPRGFAVGAEKGEAVQMGDARCVLQRLNSGCGVWRLFIWLGSSGKDGISV
jgi:hypothetical protein